MAETKQPDLINHPPHYNMGPISCWDATDVAIAGLTGGFAADMAKIIEYFWRHPHKGRPIEDMDKGLVYLYRLIERWKANPVKYPEVSEYTTGTISCWAAIDSAVTGLTGFVALELAKVLEHVWLHPYRGNPIGDLEQAAIHGNRLIGYWKKTLS
jgi:Protein of unknwon function (DUF3310)